MIKPSSDFAAPNQFEEISLYDANYGLEDINQGYLKVTKSRRKMKMPEDPLSKLIFSKRIKYDTIYIEKNNKMRKDGNPYNDQFGLIADLVITDIDFWEYMKRLSRN
jgi:hypothetical protein